MKKKHHFEKLQIYISSKVQLNIKTLELLSNYDKSSREFYIRNRDHIEEFPYKDIRNSNGEHAYFPLNLDIEYYKRVISRQYLFGFSWDQQTNTEGKTDITNDFKYDPMDKKLIPSLNRNKLISYCTKHGFFYTNYVTETDVYQLNLKDSEELDKYNKELFFKDNNKEKLICPSDAMNNGERKYLDLPDVQMYLKQKYRGNDDL